MIRKGRKGSSTSSSTPTVDKQDKDSEDWVDVAQEATEDFEHCLTPEEKDVKHLTIRARFVRTFYDLVADFTDDPEPENEEDPDGEQLAVKK